MILPHSPSQPPTPPTRVLIVDDDPIVAESIADLLAAEGYDTATACDGNEAISVLQQAKPAFSILITDLNLPRRDGLALLRDIREEHRDLVPIVITGYGKIASAVDAVKLGAADYLTKPLIDDELKLAVTKAVHQQALLAENHALRDQLSERFGLANLVGSDRRMQKVYDLISAVADSKTTVLITGESGTGKSMVGRAIHTLSPRGQKQWDHKKTKAKSDDTVGPFVTFACGSIPETLLESELFGHVRGAFTGADRDKPGKITAANGGTLFIDEINAATPALQLKLLRVLQEKTYEPVGSTQTQKADVRFVIASNEDLAELVKRGEFREDLYYRINVVKIEMPALRDRTSDVPVLAEHFLTRYTQETGKQRKLSPDTVDALKAHTWPGNVRELENAIERAVVLSQNLAITPDDLPDSVTDPVTLHRHHGDIRGGVHGIPAIAHGWHPTPLAQAMLEPERQILLAALEANGWNRNETARQLDINRTTLYKKIKQFELDRPG